MSSPIFRAIRLSPGLGNPNIDLAVRHQRCTRDPGMTVETNGESTRPSTNASPLLSSQRCGRVKPSRLCRKCSSPEVAQLGPSEGVPIGLLWGAKRTYSGMQRLGQSRTPDEILAMYSEFRSRAADDCGREFSNMIKLATDTTSKVVEAAADETNGLLRPNA